MIIFWVSVWKTTKYDRNLLPANKRSQWVKEASPFSHLLLVKSQKAFFTGSWEAVLWLGLAEESYILGALLLGVLRIFLNLMLICPQASFQNQRRHNFQRVLRLKICSPKGLFPFQTQDSWAKHTEMACMVARGVPRRKALCLVFISCQVQMQAVG